METGISNTTVTSHLFAFEGTDLKLRIIESHA